MKTIKKILTPVLLIALLAFSSSFTKKSGPITTAGIFATYQDYVNKKLTEWDEIKFVHGGYKGTLKGAKIASSYKSSPYWGGRDEDGVVYRFDKKASVAGQVITNAKICFYAGQELKVDRRDDGSVEQVNIDGVDRSTKFSEVFWFSQGGEGDFMPATQENLCKLMADNADIVAKINAKGIDEKNKGNAWFDNINNICGWIKDYVKTAK
jgi:hypothetical protein